MALATLFMGAASCTNYSKLLKSKDYDKMYHEALKYYEAKKYNKVITLLDEITPYYQGMPREDTIRFYNAAATYNTGDFQTSELLFDTFRRTFGRTSPFAEQAEYMYAMGFYYSSPKPERDQTNTVKALMAIDEYLDHYPNSPKRDKLTACIAELQRKMYDKEFLNSRLYYKIGKYKSAVTALKNALDASPENPHREEMMYLITKSGYELAHNSIESLQMDRYLKMMDYYLNFASEFPDSKYGRELAKMMDEAKSYVASHNPEKNQNKDNTDNGNEKK